MQTSVMGEEGLYILRSLAGLGGPADPLVGLLGPVLGMLLGAGLSLSCVMLGEGSQVSLLLMLLRDLPHTYSCTCFYSIKEQKLETNKDFAGCKHRGV